MKRNTWHLVFVSMTVLALLLSACTGAKAPTPTQAPTQAPTSTKAPAATQAPTSTPMPAPTATPTVAPTPTPAAAKAATFSFFEEPDSLNYLYTQMWFGTLVIDLIQRGLWVYDDNQNMVPELAAEIPSVQNGGLSADGKVLTIKLRQGVKWHDGQPVTSADVKFTYDAIMSPKNTIDTRYPYEDYFESVETPDDQTVVIHFKQPYAGWWTIFPYILPEHILGSLESLDNADWNRAPVGFGPFKFKEWLSGDHITLERNPDYWRGAPKLNTIYVKIVPSSEAQMAAIQAGGQVDIGVFHSYDEVPVLEALGTVDVKGIYYAYNELYFFNLDAKKGHPAFQDARVRRAVAMGIDRDKIAKTLLQGLTQPARTFWDGTGWDNKNIPVISYDPKAAAALLDEAGWIDNDGDGIRDKDGVKFSFTHRTTAGRKIREDAQLVVQQSLKELGIDMVIDNVAYDLFFESYADGGPIYLGDYGMAGWSDGSYPDPGTYAYYWLCDQIPSEENPTGGNFQFYCNKEVDELIRKQDTTVEPTERRAIFDRIQQIMYDETVIVPMWNDPDLWSVNKRLTNVRIGGWSPFWNAHEWDVK